MNGYNFTERVRKVLAMAREEAFRLKHEYVGTEHILLGLIREGEGVAAAVLQNLSIDAEQLRRTIDETVKPGAGGATGPDLPYTSRAKKVLELAMHEARDMNHSYVGTEHLLLGLLREERGIAAQVLASAGVGVESTRTETRRLLGEPPDAPRTRVRRSAPGHVMRPSRIFARVECEDGSRFEERFDSAADAIAWLQAFSSPDR
jgi:ATP-dependent Clp protease ATP-binding subunit ClpC